MYSIYLSKTAESTYIWLKKRDLKTFEIIKAAFEVLMQNPFEGKALKWELKGKYSYRVGSYRIIYEISKKHLIVYILDIGHRREIYLRCERKLRL